MEMNMKLNFALAIAAAVSLATTLAHVFPGSAEFLEPALAAEISGHWKAGFEAIWHAITGLLAAMTAVLVFAAFSKSMQKGVLALIALQCVAFGASFMIVGLAARGSLTDLPQWIAFFAIAFCLAWQLGPRKAEVVGGT
jgi:hypothetical protein